MKNILESFAILLVVLLSVVIVCLIVVYSSIPVNSENDRMQSIITRYFIQDIDNKRTINHKDMIKNQAIDTEANIELEEISSTSKDLKSASKEEMIDEISEAISKALSNI